MSGFTVFDAAKVQEMAEILSDDDVAKRLEELAERERDLLDGPIGEDPQMREITIYNLAVLASAVVLARDAAAKRPAEPAVSPARTDESGS